jgi:CelD/BcsL family acetyltransferase involved in cellulose biosynthesis
MLCIRQLLSFFMYLIDPITDPRWTPFVEAHPAASAFHSAGLLQALAATYRYRAMAITTTPPGSPLTDALPFCRIESRLTGRRIVSLPFADHCQPLLGAEQDLGEFLNDLADLCRREKLKFFELRPAVPFIDAVVPAANQTAEYVAHWLDTTQALDDLFKSFHKDSIQRKIRRAERENLQYEEGRSDEIIDKFYKLLVRTRRRHQVPPQPIEWFRNLAQMMRDSVQFRIASKDGAPIATVLTLTHPNSLIYKYGCSDERFHASGGMPFLYWRMIQDAKNAGIPLVDFGRSDLDNPGLIRFKDQWGTRRTELRYYRFPAPQRHGASTGLTARAAKAVFARLPNSMLALAGRVIYRHIG